MQAEGSRCRLASLLFGVMLFLGACAHGQRATDEEINVLPASYKSDILGAMHAYLNDPTGIRDSAISEPSLKSVGNDKRYVVCLRFNHKQSGNAYAGVKEIAAVFVAGRFDRFAEVRRDSGKDTGERDPASEPRGPCADATYAAFPELEKLSR